VRLLPYISKKSDKFRNAHKDSISLWLKIKNFEKAIYSHAFSNDRITQGVERDAIVKLSTDRRSRAGFLLPLIAIEDPVMISLCTKIFGAFSRKVVLREGY